MLLVCPPLTGRDEVPSRPPQKSRASVLSSSVGRQCLAFLCGSTSSALSSSREGRKVADALMEILG